MASFDRGLLPFELGKGKLEINVIFMILLLDTQRVFAVGRERVIACFFHFVSNDNRENYLRYLMMR